MTLIAGIESGLFGTKQSPRGRLGHVVERRKRRTIAIVLVDELMKLVVVNERVPFRVDFEFHVSEKHAHGVSMFARDLVLVRDELLQTCHEFNDLVVPRHVLHGQRRGVRLAAIRHAFDLDEVGLAQVDQVGVLLHVVGVPAFDERQTIHGALFLLAERFQAV